MLIEWTGDYTLSLVNVLLSISQCLLLAAFLLMVWKELRKK